MSHLFCPQENTEFTYSECCSFFSSARRPQESLDATMPWIGMYIATASAAISLAMAADAFNGLRSRKLWFPNRYFSPNAFSLTVLAVAMKLPVDLTSTMMGVYDIIARVSSLVFMSTVMGNSVASFGSMEDNEIMLNLAAIGILVLTIAGNVCINISRMHYGLKRMDFIDASMALLIIYTEQIVSTIFMFLSLVMLCSCGIMVPTAKKYIELKYQEMHKLTSTQRVEWGKFTIDELRKVVRRYWVMAQTGSPQFVIARSVTCATSGIMCLLIALILLEAWVRITLMYRDLLRLSSNYKWSVNWILYIQSIGVASGTIAPLFRWFVAAKFKSSMIGHKSFIDELKVENYWTQMLVDWRESPLPLQIRRRNVRKLVNDAKRLVLKLCIRVQVVIVLASKLLLLISATCAKAILLCFQNIKDLKTNDSEQSRAAMEQEFSRYVLLLEGEEELSKKTVKNICDEVDSLTQIGKKKQPKNLIKLLKKSVNFNGVKEFDSRGVPSLCSQQEPPNCWSLPIVTLTSIAIALPNITSRKSDQLLRGVSEGLYFVKLTEQVLHRNGELANIRNAADVVWVGVELYHKWQDVSLKSRCCNTVLQELSDAAIKTTGNFKSKAGDFLMENPLSWPVKVIAANSMYRISQTIMQSSKDSDTQIEEELFERLSVMISDIISACLTNLVRVITLKCHSSAIKEREKSVGEAALLLGESEEILEMLQQRELPSLDPEKASYIEAWRAFLEKDDENPVASSCLSSTYSNSIL